MPIPWDEADPKEKEPPQWEPRLSSIELTADGSPILPNEPFDPERFLYNVNLNGGSYGTLEIDAVPENPEDTVSVFVDGELSTTINNPQPGNFFVVEVSNGYKSAIYIVAITSGPPGTARLESLTVNTSMGVSYRPSPPLVYDVLIPAGTYTTVTFSWSVSGNTNAVEYSTNSGATWTVNTTNNITSGFTAASNASKILLIKLTSTDGVQTTYYINVRRAGATGNTLLSLTVGSSSVTIGYTMRPAYASIGYPAGTFGITAGFPSGGSVTYSGDITGSPTVGTSGTTSTITCGTLSAGVSKTILITVTAHGASNTHALILYKPDAYYVSATGGTANYGETAAAPFNQLKTALDTAQASGVSRVVVIGTLTSDNSGLTSDNYSAFYLAGTETTSYVLYGTAPGGTITISGMNNAVLKATPTSIPGPGGQRVLKIGGGHHLNFEDITITGGSFSAFGGGIFLVDSNITLLNGTKITGNAAFNGGGIYVNEAGILTIDGADVSGNTVSGGSGGAVYVNGASANVIFKSGSISGNSAIGNSTPPNGGGIYVNSGSFYMDGGVIYGNYAANSGGGVYVASGGTMIYDSGIIKTNVANGGKSIFKAIGGTVTGSVGGTMSWISSTVDDNLP